MLLKISFFGLFMAPAKWTEATIQFSLLRLISHYIQISPCFPHSQTSLLDLSSLSTTHSLFYPLSPSVGTCFCCPDNFHFFSLQPAIWFPFHAFHRNCSCPSTKLSFPWPLCLWHRYDSVSVWLSPYPRLPWFWVQLFYSSVSNNSVQQFC